jgi:nitroreductase
VVARLNVVPPLFDKTKNLLMTTEEAIQNRRTFKLRADPFNPLPAANNDVVKTKVEELVELAGKAPFHYESPENRRTDLLSGAEPWRFHTLDCQSCRKLLESLNRAVPLKAPEGIRQMLAAADALILTTWLPEPSRNKNRTFHPNLKNMEHIAAAGAAIQNLLLAATSKGVNAYWSSGGILRKPKALNYLGISSEEILIGAVFLFPDKFPDSVETKPGKNADKRGTIKDYMRWIEV